MVLPSPLPPASVLQQQPSPLGGNARPQPPASFVCFLSHFAKCLLIFFFHKETIPAKGHAGQRSLRQETRLAASSYKQHYSKHKRSNKATQATGGNGAPTR